MSTTIVDECCRLLYLADMPRAVVLGIRLSEEDHAALAQAAEADQRSMSSLAGKILVEWLRANGYAKPTAKTATRQRTRPRAVPVRLRQTRRSM
jgi:hypothetical protein